MDERPSTRRWNPAKEAEDAKRRWRIEERYREANRILEEAASPESLKGNPYRGKPLKLESNPYERDWGMAFRMLKSSGATLPWIQERADIIGEKKEIASAINAHVAWLEEKASEFAANPPADDGAERLLRLHERFIAQIEGRVALLRGRIERFNLTVPLVDQQLVNVRPEAYVEEIRSRTEGLVASLREWTP